VSIYIILAISISIIIIGLAVGHSISEVEVTQPIAESTGHLAEATGYGIAAAIIIISIFWGGTHPMQTKIIIKSMLATGIFLFFYGCGGDNRSNIEEAYRRGAQDATAHIEKQGKVLKSKVLDTLVSKFFILAVIGTAVIMFGTELADWIRRNVAGLFHIPSELQADILATCYFAITGFGLGWCLFSYDFRMMLPVLILLAGTFYPFWFQYLNSIRNGDQQKRKIAFSKVRSCLLLGLIIILVYEVLTGESRLINMLGG